MDSKARIDPMMRHRVFLAVTALAASSVFETPAGCAAYLVDFDATGAATDFVPFQINATDDGTAADNTDFAIVPGGGDAYLQVSASPPVGGSGGGASQLRYQVAPATVDGAEIAIPTGSLSTASRVEARLRVRLREITGGDDQPLENPFTQFGLTEYDPVSNAADYASKIIVQIDRSFNAGTPASPNVITLSHTTNNAAAGTTTIGTFSYPGASFSAGDVFELQVTSDQARILVNGSPLQTAGPGTDFKNLPAAYFATHFDAGDQLIPFFGLIRGPSLEDDDVVRAGFDDVNATNFQIPEPSSLWLGLASTLFLGGRPRRHR
jgi:hypothetical protein